MFVTLPLTLIGVGFLVYFLFAAASYALPLLAGLSVGFAADQAGVSGADAVLLGTAAFLLVIAVGRIATLLLPSRSARMAVVLLFAIPAAVAGFQVGSALLHLSGVGPWGVIAARDGAGNRCRCRETARGASSSVTSSTTWTSSRRTTHKRKPLPVFRAGRRGIVQCAVRRRPPGTVLLVVKQAWFDRLRLGSNEPDPYERLDRTWGPGTDLRASAPRW